MTQVPIISGIFSDTNPDFRTAYPHNMVPVPKATGVSSGYLRPAEGLVEFSAGSGPDRGAIVWDGVCFRSQGSQLVRVDSAGVTTGLGDIGSGGPVGFDYSFDYLGISSGGRLYLYDGSTLTLNTGRDNPPDPSAGSDIGLVKSFVWLDGYFVVTDGEFISVTELNDPFVINPLKYGSSEIDPDPIQALLELKNELYAVNTHSIEVFDNVGGTGFPFQRVDGAQIQKGCAGPDAAVVFDDKIAFVGGGREESPAVYLAINGAYQKISTREIEEILIGYTSDEIAGVVLEARNFLTHSFLYIHLPDMTIVFDIAGTKVAKVPVWFTLSGGIVDKTRYPARNMVWAYDRWLAGDPDSGKISELSREVSAHFGQEVKWQFNVGILYNSGAGAIVHDLELVCLTGETKLGQCPVVTTQYSTDGLDWSQPRTVSAGKPGDRAQRVSWRRQGKMRSWRTQRFSGSTDAHLSIARLEARFEPLAW